jgi:cellulose synthase (UDP-forming)
VYALDERGRAPSAGASGVRAEAARQGGGGRSGAGLARGALRTAAAVVGAVALGVVIVTPLDLRTQAALAVATFAIALVLGRRRGSLATLGLVLVSVASTARYLFWRVTTTVSAEPTIDSALGMVLFLAELYACAMLVLAYGQSLAALPRRPAPLPDDVSSWPSVDVFIPTYDEPLEVVRATVLAAAAMDWPADRLHVYLLDDGRREAFRAFAADAGVSYVTRTGNAHAKAGNLNHALAVTRGEFVAIFDCDHVPTRSFLQVTMGWLLREPRLALVQTPHHFYTPDPFGRNLRTSGVVPSESQLFYGVIQRGIDTWNASFFCGSCAVLRRSALEAVGGIAVETVTEDAHTALKLHRRGYHTAYLDVPQAAGLATETLSAHVGQRIRWARGMAQVFRVDNPLLGRGLRLSQRLCYLAAMLHFFSGIPRLVFLSAPVAYLVFGRHVFNALPLAAVVYGLPHLVQSVAANARIHGRFRHSFWSEVYETCLAWYIAIPTTLALIAPKKGRFNVTAKGGRIEAPFFDARIALPFIALIGLNVAALAFAGLRLRSGVGELDSLAINVAWAVHNLVMLSATLAAACERRQLRETPRVAVRLPAMLRAHGGGTLACDTVDLSRGGARLAVPGGARLAPGDAVWLSIFSFQDELPLRAEVVAARGGTVRLRFARLGYEEEAHLVRTLFSRADAWLSWTEGHEEDRPLLTVARIAGRGLAGMGRAVAVSVRPRPRRRTPSRRLPVEAPAEGWRW